MLVEAQLRDRPLREVADAARRAEQLGFDAVCASEVKHDPFLCLALAASATQRVRLSTSVAIAFPRSPTVVASTARGLQDLSGGRFALGLGTQVKGHIERRFGMPWESPGPKLREYILALRAIWECWQRGGPLDFRGQFYRLTLMTPEFSPPPSEFGPIPVHIGAVNTYNIRLAGEVCDGLRLHSFCTPEYIRDVVWPNLRQSAAKAGRSLESFTLIGGGFIATGPSEAAVRAAREEARRRLAFYASTRTYLPVLEHHGWGELTDSLRALIDQGRWGDLAGLVTDDVLDTFCVSGTYDVIADRAAARLGGLVDCLTLPLPDGADADGLTEAVTRLQVVPSASGGARVY